MASRAELLGDVGDSAPEHWEDCFRTRKAHVLVMISAKDSGALAERDRRIRDAIGRAGGVTAVVTQVGSALPTGREHFGYADGFSQPAIEGSRFPDQPERARPPSTASGGRSAPASSSSATPTSRAHCPPRRRPTSSAATAPTSSTASCARTSPPSGASCASRCAVPGPGGATGRQARRPLARRHAARLLTPSRGPGAGGRQVAQQRVRLRSRPERPALPARLAHPPHEPAAEHAVRGKLVNRHRSSGAASPTARCCPTA